MTREETINALQNIEDRAVNFPMTASDWVAIAAAKRQLSPNSVWHDENIVPKFNFNGISDLIVSSCYGHIQAVPHTYTPEEWKAHVGFNINREFRWAYEKDLIDFD